MFFKVVIFAYWSLVTWGCISCRRLEQPLRIPPEVEICNASDPRINICFRSAANRMLKYLIKGLPEAGVAALDPVSVAWLHLPRGNDMLPALSFNASNSVHRGWRGAFVRKATARPREYVFDFEIAVPHYNISGEYSVDGMVMGFVPLSGHGPFTITTEDDTLWISLKGSPEKRGEHIFLKLDDVRFDLYIGDMTFELHNLFGNEAVSSATNNLLNWYSKTMSRNVIPAAKYFLGIIYEEKIRQFFDTVPYDSLFTDL